MRGDGKPLGLAIVLIAIAGSQPAQCFPHPSLFVYRIVSMMR
jgi:hypothetical protein